MTKGKENKLAKSLGSRKPSIKKTEIDTSKIEEQVKQIHKPESSEVQKRYHKFNVRLNDDEHMTLKRYCFENNISMAEFSYQAVIEKMKRVKLI